MAKVILVVDHEEPIREIIASMLVTAGYDCLVAANGAEALAVLDSGKKVDLITSALLMPELDGFGLLMQVKQRYPGVPFVMVSAVNDKSVTELAIREGARDYLLKPFDRSQLFSTVDRVLGVQRPRPESQFWAKYFPPRSHRVSAESDFGPLLFGVYWIGCCITWVVVFVGCWIYCISEYGFLLGVGLGWLPSFIVASVASLLWPLILIVLIALFAR